MSIHDFSCTESTEPKQYTKCNCAVHMPILSRSERYNRHSYPAKVKKNRKCLSIGICYFAENKTLRYKSRKYEGFHLEQMPEMGVYKQVFTNFSPFCLYDFRTFQSLIPAHSTEMSSRNKKNHGSVLYIILKRKPRSFICKIISFYHL